MSVQFGRWNLDGRPIDQEHLEEVRELLIPYGRDHLGTYLLQNVGVIYCGFHTTAESRYENQPHIMSSGAVLTWDGRLDNRTEFIDELHETVTLTSTDVEIVAATYERWGTGCFALLLGDWALSIWEPRTHSLILAKDPIGVRHLYYSVDDHHVTWSTVLDPLVLLSRTNFSLCEEYIAGWFSLFPAAHVTPYVGIHSVPPSSSVLIREGAAKVRKYWDFDPEKRIRYHTDEEYEEHFRAMFTEAVHRRLRSDNPILAELSGGMDSSSIVCMADKLIAESNAETPRLDTISYYNNSEPNWDEHPYFTKVEEKRGRIGCHIDVSKRNPFNFEIDIHEFAATPAYTGKHGDEASRRFADCIALQNNRVVLSGIGGDEVMGGVPTPTPELEDLLARAKFGHLAHQLKVWALNKRKPWFYLLSDAVSQFLPTFLVGIPEHKRPAPWLSESFVKRNRSALRGYEGRLSLFGALPSFQENVATLRALQRQLSCTALPLEPQYEKRYPYLDRSLLEFLYAIPRDQLVRPGQRRSLMRRALTGIVPDELLNRKRKAFITRGPLAAISANWSSLVDFSNNMQSSALGIIDAERFMGVLQRARSGQEVLLVVLMRTFGVEIWLRNLTRHDVIRHFTYQKKAHQRVVSRQEQINVVSQ